MWVACDARLKPGVGARARGEYTHIGMKIAPGRTLLDLVGMRLAFEDLLAINVDVTTLDMLKPSAREAVGREAVPL